jgi:hypothetical protein
MSTELTRRWSRTPNPPAVPGDPGRQRRDEIAIAVFGSWMITGLYLDGWAHGAGKPETFFSPWHGVLYSGFVAALLWFGVEAARRPAGEGAAGSFVPTDRLTTIGLGLFVLGAVGDGVWHEIFGIEIDLEALLSPTHLLLLIGGFLMVTGPVRAAWVDPHEHASSLRSFLPTVVTLTLATALVSFFTLYLSAFQGVATYWRGTSESARELTQIVGVGSILVTNLILLAPVVFVLRRWRPPPGTFTILFGVVAVSVTGLDGFDRVELAVAGVLGGVTADVLVGLGWSLRAIAGTVPLVTWSSLFVLVELGPGIAWSAELVAGPVVLAAVSGVLLATIAGPPPGTAGAGQPSTVRKSISDSTAPTNEGSRSA